VTSTWDVVLFIFISDPCALVVVEFEIHRVVSRLKPC